jgi:hypothetical protein
MKRCQDSPWSINLAPLLCECETSTLFRHSVIRTFVVFFLMPRHYLRGWFILDIASGIPFSLLTVLATINDKTASVISSLKLLKSLRLLRFFKLARLFKFKGMLDNIDKDTVDIIEVGATSRSCHC